MTERTVKTLEDVLVGEESYEYDAAGNITGAAEGSYVCDVNNRLTEACGHAIAYDMDGNMTSGPLGGTTAAFAYDSGNRLIKAGDCAYTYDAEDLRIRSEEGGTQTEYTYNPQAKLSQLLMRTKDGAVTKYVYGLGLIGEESGGEFRTYHFDSRGSTVAVTGGMGDVTNTFAYDAYGRLTEKVGLDDILFCYNGKYGVITEPSGLVYMRARYYSPELRRFINADVVAGEISNAITLNRYAYANGNPISNVDPLGLTAERENATIFDAMRNQDGSYSLYDNDRFYDRNAFHEQILAFTPSRPAFQPLEGNIGLGGISADLITGGWENEYVDLSLLDFGHAEASAEIKDGQLSVGAMASIWSPSVSFNLFGLTIELGLEVGSVGGSIDLGSGGLGVSVGGPVGVSFGVSWD